MRKLRRKRVAVASMAVALAAAGSAAAFQQLPAGDQVNNDPTAGINPALGVDGGDPTNADVVGGALVAGSAERSVGDVPRSTRAAAKTRSSSARSSRPVHGRRRAAARSAGRPARVPTFTGSLNFDQAQDGEAPAIDFAGTGRTVPWATWYENTTGIRVRQQQHLRQPVRQQTTNQGKWIFGGQGRGLGGGSVPVPSLNIHTNQDAENPSVAGGSAADPTKPGPWVTWQETGANAPGTGKDQIFTVKPLGPGRRANCDGIKPVGVVDGTGHVPASVDSAGSRSAIERLGADPSMNVDPTRDGIEPDIAFTGDEATPCRGSSGTRRATSAASGLNNNEMVFAAKGVGRRPHRPATAASTGSRSGGTGSGVAGRSSARRTCGASADAPRRPARSTRSATATPRIPRVASGTMIAGNPTVSVGHLGRERSTASSKIFVSRLVTSPAPNALRGRQQRPADLDRANDATRPDITFDGNTPYVSWREDIERRRHEGLLGHFIDAANRRSCSTRATCR